MTEHWYGFSDKKKNLGFSTPADVVKVKIHVGIARTTMKGVGC
jgi:hypothetical protein